MPLFKILTWSKKKHLLQNSFLYKTMKSCIEKKTCRNIEYIYSMTLLSEEKNSGTVWIFIGLISSNNTSF